MSKTIKIILYIAILLFGYFTISAIYKSCNSDKDPSVIQDETITSDDEDDFFNDFDESDESSNSEDTNDNDENIDNSTPEIEPDDVEEIDYQSLDDKLNDGNNSTDDSTNDETEVFQEEPKKVPTYTKNYSTGKYLVVSGSFLVKQNALNLVTKLKRMGYNGAELVMFDGSSYFTVVAERTNTRSSARSIVSSLKNKGVDSYMHTKQ